MSTDPRTVEPLLHEMAYNELYCQADCNVNRGMEQGFIQLLEEAKQHILANPGHRPRVRIVKTFAYYWG